MQLDFVGVFRDYVLQRMKARPVEKCHAGAKQVPDKCHTNAAAHQDLDFRFFPLDTVREVADTLKESIRETF